MEKQMAQVQPDRLLFFQNSGRELKIYYENNRLPDLTGGSLADLKGISGVIMREGLRAWKINDSALTPKQRLARSRADIRRRAAQSRPRIRRG
ncbi:MAG: hypothetical protein ACK587_08130 [Cyanobacteriota bacterium]|jgi:hypothetical protein